MINTIQLALQGLTGAAKKAEGAAANIAGAGAAAAAGDPAFDVSLSEEAVRLSAAKTEYKANLGVIRTATEMQDELLKSFDKTV